jgi:hypothetical protein
LVRVKTLPAQSIKGKSEMIEVFQVLGLKEEQENKENK